MNFFKALLGDHDKPWDQATILVTAQPSSVDCVHKNFYEFTHILV